MGSTRIRFSAGDNNNINNNSNSNNIISSGMPSFTSQTQAPNPMGTEGNTTQAPRIANFGVYEQYLGYRLTDTSDVNLNYNANIGQEFSPTLNTQSVGLDLQNGAFDKNLAPTNTNLPIIGSEALQLQEGPQMNLVSTPGAQLENWGESNMAESSSRTDTSTEMDQEDTNQKFDMVQSIGVGGSDSSDKSKGKTPDQKTQRRLAQNREAARKSRLRKKAYVQQLENSRLKLIQLEQELKLARQQGTSASSTGDQSHEGSRSGALAFDAEYARWMEDQNRQINELRTAVNSHAGDTELRTVVENVTAHYNDIFSHKRNAAKADVFHILSGMWKTPAERCFMWIGGFRPSALLKLLVHQLEPLTEQQLNEMYSLQQSSHQAEDALSQGMEALQQSLSQTLAKGSTSGPEGSSRNVANYMGQMAMALGKLGTLEGFLRQADNLRQQTLHQMHLILTTRQSARALMLINDYFSRLRALSALWIARPRE